MNCRVRLLVVLSLLVLIRTANAQEIQAGLVPQAESMPIRTDGEISKYGSNINDFSGQNAKVAWKLTVVMLGPVDPVQQAEVPINEAISFIESRTRLKLEVEYVMSYSAYDYTPYYFGEDKNGDGVGDEVAYLMMGWNLPSSLTSTLPVSASYLFLSTMNGLRPLQAGSALGVKNGIWIGGKPRSYSSVPVDQWWYVNEPYEGFESRAAQILTHEIINTIQGRIEAPPYRCPQLTATWGLPPARFESERLLKLTDKCYEKLSRIND